MLNTDSTRVPVDDQFAIKSRVERKMYPDEAVEEAKKKEDQELKRGNHLDQNYVNQFLKEIDEIETINLRADKYNEDRSFETNMRRAPAVQ